jgi:hypothetical protein
MYNSGIKSADLIQSVTEEADIVIPISDTSWYRWINAVEQFVYTEIFLQFVSHELDFSELADGVIDMSALIPAIDGCDTVCFDDIVKIYADDVELDRSGVISAIVFGEKPLYYTDYDGHIKLNIPDGAEKIKIVYKLRPRLKAEGDDSIINLPVEFVDMLAARLRAEAYKIANEDGQAAKWSAEYNAQLETLKMWAAMRSNRYGE